MSSLEIVFKNEKLSELPTINEGDCGYILHKNSALISQDWHNDYLNKRQGQEYTKWTSADLCKLGESWITMFYAGYLKYITASTVILALHLKNPENWKELFSPFQQNPKFPPNFRGNPEKEMLRCNYQALTSLSSFLMSEERVAEVEELIKLQPSLLNLIHGIKLMEVKKQAAFYSFLAAITCCLVCKNERHVAAQWKFKAVFEFKNFYQTPNVSFVLPPPSFKALGSLKNFLSAGNPFTVALYKAFLPVYKEACLKSQEKVKRLLDFTFLQPTSMAGLGLVTYVVKAARYEEYSSLKEFFKKIRCKTTKKSIKMVRDFMKQYPLAQPLDSESDWWKWSRNININSFLALSLKSNRDLAIICMGLLATSENDNIFKAKSINATNEEIKNVMELLKDHKESKIFVPKQRSNIHFNVEEEFKYLHL